MRTSKPCSTISYNSENFLRVKLDELVKNRILDFWVFIDHAAEEDEEKAHKHLYIIPGALLDTDVLKEYLAEPDPTHPDKPLNCTIFTSSKFDDWYLYGLHDKAYLSSKGQTRKYHYVKSQFVTSSDEHFSEMVRCVDRSKYIGLERVVDAVENGVPFFEMVRLGQIPIQLINQYQYAYDMLTKATLNRAGRETHTPKYSEEEAAKCFDPVTGELLDIPPNVPTKQTKIKV
jgi:hypothetical protein